MNWISIICVMFLVVLIVLSIAIPVTWKVTKDSVKCPASPVCPAPVTCAPSPAKFVTGTTVRLTHNGNTWLNLTEIEIYDENGQIISRGPGVTLDTINTQTSRPPSNINDGDFTTLFHSDSDNTKEKYIEFKFSTPKNISKIVIYNRMDCCKQRIKGAVLTISNGAQQVWKSATNGIKWGSYVIIFKAPFVNDMSAEHYPATNFDAPL